MKELIKRQRKKNTQYYLRTEQMFLAVFAGRVKLAMDIEGEKCLPIMSLFLYLFTPKVKREVVKFASVAAVCLTRIP